MNIKPFKGEQAESLKDEKPKYKMTRREKRDFKRKLAKPKYQKIAKRIIENKK